MKPNGTVHLSDIPELAREWDFEKNISDLTPDKITVGSNRIVWWRCAKGHSWKDAVVKRTHGKPCPYCTNRHVLIGYNDLATLYPKLANEWDYSNNVGVDINTVVPGCTKKVSWKCSSCGHIWVASIQSRTRKGTGCPICAKKVAVKHHRETFLQKNGCLQDAKLLESWDYEKNAPLKPENVTASSSKSVWWKCSLGHSWKAKISDRTIIGEKCTVCESEYRSVFPGLAVAYYANQKGLKVQLGSDKLLGIPLETYIPSEKLAIEFTNGSEHMEVLKSHLCKQRNIKLVKLPFKTTETEAEYADRVKAVFKSVHIFIYSDVEADVSVIRAKFNEWRKRL